MFTWDRPLAITSYRGIGKSRRYIDRQIGRVVTLKGGWMMAVDHKRGAEYWYFMACNQLLIEQSFDLGRIWNSHKIEKTPVSRSSIYLISMTTPRAVNKTRPCRTREYISTPTFHIQKSGALE